MNLKPFESDCQNVKFAGRCDNLKEADLHEFDDSSRSIGYETFRRKVGKVIAQNLDHHFGVPLKKDYAVSFVKGKWKGRPAVCLFHSAYHHIWTLAPG